VIYRRAGGGALWAYTRYLVHRTGLNEQASQKILEKINQNFKSAKHGSLHGSTGPKIILTKLSGHTRRFASQST
jgi:hypothetical protein